MCAVIFEDLEFGPKKGAFMTPPLPNIEVITRGGGGGGGELIMLVDFVKINEKIEIGTPYIFNQISKGQVEKEIQLMDSIKAVSHNIPVKILKQTSQIYSHSLCSSYNNSIAIFLFPANRKMLISLLYLKMTTT